MNSFSGGTGFPAHMRLYKFEYVIMSTTDGIIRVVQYSHENCFNVPYHVIPPFERNKLDKYDIGHWILAIAHITYERKSSKPTKIKITLMDPSKHEARLDIASKVLKEFYLAKFVYVYMGEEIPKNMITSKFNDSFHIIPLFSSNHWFLAITLVEDVDGHPNLNVTIMDSLVNGRKNRFVRAKIILEKFYIAAYKLRMQMKSKVFDEIKLKIFFKSEKKYGSQNNADDCGPFTIFFTRNYFVDAGFESKIKPNKNCVGQSIRNLLKKYWAKKIKNNEAKWAVISDFNADSVSCS